MANNSDDGSHNKGSSPKPQGGKVSELVENPDQDDGSSDDNNDDNQQESSQKEEGNDKSEENEEEEDDDEEEEVEVEEIHGQDHDPAPESGEGNSSSNSSSKKPSSRKRRLDFGNKNLLTNLVPGYTAPMRLVSSSLERIRPQGGLQAMVKEAARQEAQVGCQHAKLMAQRSSSNIAGGMSDAYRATHAAATVPKKQQKKARKAQATTAGEGWFQMRPSAMTDELKQDMAMIRNRTYLDPKRFYKSADMGGKHSNNKFVQTGTVVEGPSEFYSSRLTKKQRRSNLVEEIMADPASSEYARNKFRKTQQEKQQEHQKWRKRNPNARAKDFRKLK